jgi:Tat protein translocase TatB subunit
MFGISMPELILILVIALIVVGPEKLPELAKKMGRMVGEFKRAASDFKESMDVEDEVGAVKKSFNETGNDIKGIIDLKPSGVDDSGADDIKKNHGREKNAALPEQKSVPEKDKQSNE